jgi:2-polyprenyl-6-methoxyphenol hydroxylase-like FAD-dependent oxidoreductase
METDVLVVGAGPTGLMLANQLGRRGIRAMIVDRHSGPAQQTRAMAVQARTLEIYSKLGIVNRALDLGSRGTGANMWAEGRWTARIPVGDIGELSPYPFVLMLEQDDNERIMGERLMDRTWPLWNTELVGLAGIGHDRYSATGGATRIVKAAWVAKCDGRAVPRELAHHLSAPHSMFFVADTEAMGSMRPGGPSICGVTASSAFRCAGNRWRSSDPAAEPAENDLTLMRWCRNGRKRDRLWSSPRSWFSTYRIHHRCAGRFRDRRCFLLGDAAHVHSPMGGQGMNTGLQDAYNLAWKLALAIQGRADASLLDTYERERIPVAQRLLRTTDRAFQLLVSENWMAGLFRTKVIARIAAFAMTQDSVRQFAFRTLSQTGIRYRQSPLSRMLASFAKGAPVAGDRFPWLQLKLRVDGPVEELFQMLDDTRFNLIVIGQPAAPAEDITSGSLLSTHVIPADPVNEKELARAQIPAPSFYLLRPDGHVGLAGTHMDAAALTRYLTDHHIRLDNETPGTAALNLPRD